MVERQDAEERIGLCHVCHDETAPVRPDGGEPGAPAHICQPCAIDEHQRGRVTAWWDGPAVAQAPPRRVFFGCGWSQ